MRLVAGDVCCLPLCLNNKAAKSMQQFLHSHLHAAHFMVVELLLYFNFLLYFLFNFILYFFVFGVFFFWTPRQPPRCARKIN